MHILIFHVQHPLCSVLKKFTRQNSIIKRGIILGCEEDHLMWN
jgi:hypothetical protein